MIEASLYGSDPRSYTLEGMIVGLQILAKYMPNGEQQEFPCQVKDGNWVGFNISDTTLKEDTEDTEDGRALIALGFFVNQNVHEWVWFT